jgi:nucleoside-diphosphate-sugar epimerase
MKILVTGATGFVGSHVADLLLEQGHEVRCTIRKTSNIRWLQDKPIELIDASFSDVESLQKACEGVDYIIHSAGIVAAKNYEGYLRGNRDATRNLLTAAKLSAPNLKRFLHVSSQTAAGPAVSLDKPITEDMPPRPITAYGRSKIEAENEVLKVKNEIPITIIRPPAVYGPRDTAILQMFLVAKKGLGTLIGFNKKYLNLIHSDDLARGIVDATFSENTAGKIYYVASEEIYNWVQIIDSIKNSMDIKFFLKLRIPHFVVYTIAGITEFIGRFQSQTPVFNLDKGRDFVQTYWICSVESAKRDFGFRQTIGLEEGMKSTIKWYKDYGWL